MQEYLEFEKSTLKPIDDKIAEYNKLNKDGDLNDKIKTQEEKYQAELTKLYAKLTPWQKTQVARHPARPHASEIIAQLIKDYTQLSGDRLFAEDAAIVGGIGRFNNRPVMVIAHEKGNDTESRIKHNFGMAKPEGYRKAQRLMKMAAHFKLPILTFVDTAGAWPGIDAEERGQSEAIAKSIDTCLSVETPLIATIVGEGGSGGAIALATANKVNMLEYSIYSVISPEGCASILWRDGAKAKDAADTLRLTADDLKSLEVIDEIIAEPLGAAHRDKKVAIAAMGKLIETQLAELEKINGKDLKNQRRDKFLAMGKKGLS
ncbi:MAG: acetyl-CoA carboxylase carboxyltransferase subunit alpha [Alphaproteobacteria bacterium]